MPTELTRRGFVASATAAATLRSGRAGRADEGPPETTTLRLIYDPNICLAPLYIAEDLLRAEGFTDVHWLPFTDPGQVARGEAELDVGTAALLASQLDAGEPITALAGVHAGCYELFANEPIRTIRDLKGRRVGIQSLGSAGHLYLAIMVAQVGLDPHADIRWVASPSGDFTELLREAEVDAFLAFPPEPQELRARKVGRMILSLTTEKPWSQYFCCMAFGHRRFVRDHPIATKRYLRAILKAADLCASDPRLAARRLVDGRFTPRLDYAVQALTELPYRSWRQLDPADTLLFYALRLHEVGMIRSSPSEILATGTDWRFLDEIKRELKA